MIDLIPRTIGMFNITKMHDFIEGNARPIAVVFNALCQSAYGSILIHSDRREERVAGVLFLYFANITAMVVNPQSFHDLLIQTNLAIPWAMTFIIGIVQLACGIERGGDWERLIHIGAMKCEIGAFIFNFIMNLEPDTALKLHQLLRVGLTGFCLVNMGFNNLVHNYRMGLTLLVTAKLLCGALMLAPIAVMASTHLFPIPESLPVYTSEPE